MAVYQTLNKIFFALKPITYISHETVGTWLIYVMSSSFTYLFCLSLSWINSKWHNCIGIVYVACVVRWSYCSLDTQTHICIMNGKLPKQIHNDSRGTSAPTNTSLLSSVSMWEKTTHQVYSLSRGSTLITCIRELPCTFLFVTVDATAVSMFMWNCRNCFPAWFLCVRCALIFLLCISMCMWERMRPSALALIEACPLSAVVKWSSQQNDLARLSDTGSVVRISLTLLPPYKQNNYCNRGRVKGRQRDTSALSKKEWKLEVWCIYHIY